MCRTYLLQSTACLLLVVGFGCGRGASTPEEEAHPAPVKAAPVRRAVLQQWTEFSGTSLPLIGRTAQISAAVDGRVLAVSAHEGQEVAAGQVIVQLDDRILAAERPRLEAAVKELVQLKAQAEL